MSLSDGKARPFIIHDLTKQRPIFLLLSLKAITQVVMLIYILKQVLTVYHLLLRIDNDHVIAWNFFHNFFKSTVRSLGQWVIDLAPTRSDVYMAEDGFTLLISEFRDYLGLLLFLWHCFDLASGIRLIENSFNLFSVKAFGYDLGWLLQVLLLVHSERSLAGLYMNVAVIHYGFHRVVCYI